MVLLSNYTVRRHDFCEPRSDLGYQIGVQHDMQRHWISIRTINFHRYKIPGYLQTTIPA